MSKRRYPRTIIILVALFFAYLIPWFVLVFPQMDREGVVPLFGLQAVYHSLVNYTLVPIVGSIICIVAFPRAFAPLYIRYKGLRGRRYKNAYLGFDVNALTLRKWLTRGLMCFMLTMGLSATLMEIQLFHPALFMTPDNYAHAREMYTELFLTYAPNYFFGVFNLIAPICVGLWSVGWAFEDAGLIHYSLPKGGLEEYFEIEPVHYRYNTLLGGYAGLSAFFFYLGALLFYLVPGSRGYYLNPDPNSPGDLMVLFFMVTIAGLTPIMLVPAYLVYWLVGVNFLRKNLEESRGISEKEFRKSIVDKAYEGR